ncbi:uncharacterized protein LOC126669937 [Mercurialis annua]|uniref:uncharacterized protein LOC126669937 n=1 Tax=Mercurialis annua TaxID=3986 RepID=UPI002160DC0C|nr:uncharacterized protein LOC126669937 [Mercurialis annua]
MASFVRLCESGRYVRSARWKRVILSCLLRFIMKPIRTKFITPGVGRGNISKSFHSHDEIGPLGVRRGHVLKSFHSQDEIGALGVRRGHVSNSFHSLRTANSVLNDDSRSINFSLSNLSKGTEKGQPSSNNEEVFMDDDDGLLQSNTNTEGSSILRKLRTRSAHSNVHIPPSELSLPQVQDNIVRESSSGSSKAQTFEGSINKEG